MHVLVISGHMGALRREVCRVESYFVIPTNRIITDPAEKEQEIEQYQMHMAKVPRCLLAFLKPVRVLPLPPPAGN